MIIKLTSWKIRGFHNGCYADVSCKYQNKEKPLKRQRRLGLPDDGRSGEGFNLLSLVFNGLEGCSVRDNKRSIADFAEDRTGVEEIRSPDPLSFELNFPSLKLRSVCFAPSDAILKK